MVSERDTGIGVSIAGLTRPSGHIMADTQTIAVYHSNTWDSDFDSCFTVFSMAGFSLYIKYNCRNSLSDTD
jgi:hypothetical protein